MQFSTKAIAVAALVACLISAASAGSNKRHSLNACAVDAALQSLGPYTEPTIQLGAPLRGNQLLQQSSSSSSFSVDTAGVGQATGTSFTVPAFSQANVTIALSVPALTSLQVKNLRDAWEAILDLTQRESLREYERRDTSASRNLGFLGWFCGGKTSRSSTTTRLNMQRRGLSNDQIQQLIDTFIEIASQMSSVQLDFTIYNQNNPYSVSGNVLIWVMSGYITSSETQTQYRVLSDGGIATGDNGNSNAGGDIIPLVL